MENKKDRKSLIALIISGISCALVVALGAIYLVNLGAAKKNIQPDYTIYVGTNDKDTYKIEMTEEEAYNLVDGICTKYFEYGYTLSEATGSWRDENDKITHEYTLVCYVSGVEKELVYEVVDVLREALNQNTILIRTSYTTVEYYSGK